MDDVVAWSYPKYKNYPLVPLYAYRSSEPVQNKDLLIQGITRGFKDLNLEFNKWVSAEKTKFLKKQPVKPKTSIQKQQLNTSKKKATEKLKTLENEVIIEVKKVREKKQIEAKKVAKKNANYIFKMNDKVRITGSNSCGTIDKIEKNNAFINYGNFTTKTTLSKLELVESAKIK